VDRTDSARGQDTATRRWRRAYVRPRVASDDASSPRHQTLRSFRVVDHWMMARPGPRTADVQYYQARASGTARLSICVRASGARVDLGGGARRKLGLWSYICLSVISWDLLV
jgi:hypothetical protein